MRPCGRKRLRLGVGRHKPPDMLYIVRPKIDFETPYEYYLVLDNDTMANNIVWYIGEGNKQVSIRRTLSAGYVEQPDRLGVCSQPPQQEPLRLRDRRRVRADSERRAMELESRPSITRRFVDRFRASYLCCMEWLS